jgi:creatinine amidohydrolase
MGRAVLLLFSWVHLAMPVPAASTEQPGTRLGDIPWTEAEPLLTRDRVVVLPLGAGTKEHGPHLLLRNDQILADYFADRVLAARPVLLLPTLTYGYYPAFLEYPGSVSLSFDTQRDLVVQICRSLARYGPRRFYVLNTGISTARSLAAAVDVLAREGVLLRYTDIEKAGRAAREAVRQEKHGTHADEIETSMVLYMKPDAVRMEKAVSDGGVPAPRYLTRQKGRPQDVYSPSGVFGDATLATRLKGEKVTEAMVVDILAEIDALAQAPLPAGAPASPLEKAP